MAKQTDPNPLGFSPEKAGNKLGLSTGVIRQKIHDGSLPAIRVGKRWIIPVKALEAWLEEQIQK